MFLASCINHMASDDHRGGGVSVLVFFFSFFVFVFFWFLFLVVVVAPSVASLLPDLLFACTPRLFFHWRQHSDRVRGKTCRSNFSHFHHSHRSALPLAGECIGSDSSVSHACIALSAAAVSAQLVWVIRQAYHQHDYLAADSALKPL